MNRILTASAFVALAALTAAPALAATTTTTAKPAATAAKTVAKPVAKKPAAKKPVAKPAAAPVKKVVTFKSLDTNHDGKISLAEIQKVWPSVTKAVFAKYDANKDGFYNHAELAAFGKSLKK